MAGDRSVDTNAAREGGEGGQGPDEELVVLGGMGLIILG
jgi:hypothetical protein